MHKNSKITSTHRPKLVLHCGLLVRTAQSHITHSVKTKQQIDLVLNSVFKGAGCFIFAIKNRNSAIQDVQAKSTGQSADQQANALFAAAAY